MSDEEKKSTLIRMAAIDDMIEDLRYKGQIMARTNKLESGVMSGGLLGLAIGIGLSFVFVFIPWFVLSGGV